MVVSAMVRDATVRADADITADITHGGLLTRPGLEPERALFFEKCKSVNETGKFQLKLSEILRNP